MLGCPAIALSVAESFADNHVLERQIFRIRRKPPVSNSRRQSLTFIFGSNGLRNTPQGS